MDYSVKEIFKKTMFSLILFPVLVIFLLSAFIHSLLNICRKNKEKNLGAEKRLSIDNSLSAEPTPLVISQQNQHNQQNLVDKYEGISRVSLISEKIYQEEEPSLIDDQILSFNWDTTRIYLSCWDRNSDSYYYHYTSIENARQILNDKIIIAKKPKVNIFPTAVYFTTLSPHSTDIALIKNNYIHYNENYKRNIKCVFAIEKSDLELDKINDRHNRDIWSYLSDIDLTIVNFKLILRD